MTWFAIRCVFCALVFIGAAQADFDSALAAYETGNYASAG